MNYEEQVINLINSVMPKSPLRKSILGEVDCEVILLDGKEYLFTTDDFSHEDLLQEVDPYILGWNISCGAISDIIAAGGKPLVYSHSMVIPNYWDTKYIKGFSEGISALLNKYSVSFIGGDLGIAADWRYTASVIGVPLGRMVNRKGCKAGDAIFITGRIGAGNLDAVMNLYSSNEGTETLLKGTQIKFRSHEKLPEIISKYASCAIDTSDGVFAALKAISNLNNTGFQICCLPFISQAALAASILQVSELLFFLGECGEYEILFTISRHNKDTLIAELEKLGIEAYEIGEITGSYGPKTVNYEDNNYDLENYNIRARDFVNVNEYLKKMTEWVMTKGNCR